MRIEEAVRHKLIEVTNLERWFPDAIPEEQNEWPCGVFAQTESDEQYALSGPPPTDHRDTFDLALWGPNRTDLMVLRDKLLGGFAGANCHGLWGEVCVDGAFARNVASQTSPAVDGSDRHDRAVQLSLVICWQGRRN